MGASRLWTPARDALKRLGIALDQTLRLQPVALRGEWPHLLLVFGVLWALYLYTAPRTVVLEDDGLFILSGYFLGIEHPPGFPLYVLAAKLATLVPLGSVAWRVHALSGLFAASACVMVWLCARLLVPGRLPAYLAAIGYGLSLTFWSQALIADVYSLNSLFFFSLLLLTLRQARVGSARGLYAIAFVGGLGAANHWPLLLISAPGLMLVLWPRRWDILRRLPLLLAAGAAGLLPYAWMVWRSQASPEISFSGPIDDWSELLFYLSRSGYRGVDESLSAGWVDKLGYIGFLVREAAVQMTPVGLVLALAGWWGGRSLWPPAVRYGLLAAFLGPTLGLALLLSFDDQWMQRLAFRVYPLVGWGILALWAAAGLHLLRERLPAGVGARVSVALAVLTIAASLLLHWEANDRQGDTLGGDYAATVLRSLEPDSVLFVAGDAPSGTIAYLNRIEGVRSDVTVMHEDGLLLEPRLFDPATTSIPDRGRVVDEFVRRSERPVHFLHHRGGGPGERAWLTFRPDRGGAGGDIRYRLVPAELELASRIASFSEMSDGWDELFRRYLLARFAAFATRTQLAAAPARAQPDLSEILERALAVPEAKVARAEVLASTDPRRYRGEIAALSSAAAVQLDARTDKKTQASLFLLTAMLAEQAGRGDTMRRALRQSLAAWPHPDNPARSILKSLAASPGEPGAGQGQRAAGDVGRGEDGAP